MLGELIADGRTSEVYRYGSDGAAKILKSSTPQHWADVEASFTESVARLGLPAPEVREVINVEGRAAVVFERIVGPSMWQRMVERPADVVPLMRDLANLHGSIRAAGVPDRLPSLVDRMRLKLRGAAELSDIEQNDAVRLLESLPQGAALLHGDLHPGNILLAQDGLVVIDWFDATVGHPSADVARTALLLQAQGATDLRHLPGASNALVDRAHAAYLGASELGDRSENPQNDGAWLRLMAASRLAERTDGDVSGLLAMWRTPRGSTADDDVAE